MASKRNKVLSRKRIKGGRNINKRRLMMRSKKQRGGKRGRPKLLPNVTTVADTYNSVNEVRDIAAYNPRENPELNEYIEEAAEEAADNLESSESSDKDFLESSEDEHRGLIGDDDDYGLQSMKKYDKAQRDELESKMGTPALVDMRKMKKEHFPGLGIMSTIAQAMGASKKKRKRKKKGKTEKQQKRKKDKKKKRAKKTKNRSY